MLEVWLLGVVAIAVAVGVVLQRITGMGVGSVTAPALILIWGPVVGVQLVNALAALCSLVLLVQLWPHVDLRRTSMLMGVAVAATPLGVMMVLALPAATLQILIGALMLAALFTVRPIAKLRIIRSRTGVAMTGALVGIANSAVGQAGPLMGAFALSTRWEMRSYVASMQLCWFVVNTAAVLLKGIPPVAPHVLIVMGAALATGFLIAIFVTRYVTRASAERWLLVVALTGALLVLGKGLVSLIWL